MERPGASQERSWTVPGAPWTAPGVSWSRPGASLHRPGAPRRLQDRFWSDFCSIFRRFWVDLSSIFAFRVRLFRCFRRAGAARRVACAVAAASDKALTSWGLRLPPCSAASPVPGVRAFSRTAVLARSHAPRATCRTPRSPPCSAPSTALYPAAADVLRIAERCRQRACAPRSASRSCCVGLPPCSATCSKPRPSDYLPPPPFSPVHFYRHGFISCCCRRASQSVAFNALAHGRALRVRGYLLKPPFSPVQRYRHSSIGLLSTCVASRSVSFNWLAHGRALRVRTATATR